MSSNSISNRKSKLNKIIDGMHELINKTSVKEEEAAKKVHHGEDQGTIVSKT